MLSRQWRVIIIQTLQNEKLLIAEMKVIRNKNNHMMEGQTMV